MVVQTIEYHPDYKMDFQRLEKVFQKRVVKAEALFRLNPLHPSLRLHRLHGKLTDLWSLSVTIHIRILFRRVENGDIIFLSVGQHDLYRSA